MNLHFCCVILCFPESSSHRPRSISCWFTMLMPFFMIKNTVMLHVSTAWHCNRRRSSAKHPKFEHLRVELQPTCKRRYGRKDQAGLWLSTWIWENKIWVNVFQSLPSEIEVKYKIAECYTILKLDKDAIAVLEGIPSRQRTPKVRKSFLMKCLFFNFYLIFIFF